MNTFIRNMLIPVLLIIALPFVSIASVNIVTYQSFLKDNSDAYIDWVTNGEVDNDYFTIERSSNGTSFTPYAIVQGNGTTTMRQHYRVIDKNPHAGTTYYRLIQTDLSGQKDTFSIVTVTKQINLENNNNLVFAPNPVNSGNTFKVNGYDNDFDHQPVQIYHLATGQLVFESTAKPEKSEFRLPENLSSGMYIIRMVNVADKVISQPFIVK